MQPLELSVLERDALTELVNIAMSDAASRLRLMVGSHVYLSVPAIDIVEPAQAAASLTCLGLDQIVAVRQNFDGRLSGQTMLVFSEDDSGNLARAILGPEHAAKFEALRDDTLTEIGNVLLLGFLATIGSMLGLTFDVTVPTVTKAQPKDIFQSELRQVILIVYVNFDVRQISARGYFSLVLGLGTFAALRDTISAFIRDLGV